MLLKHIGSGSHSDVYSVVNTIPQLCCKIASLKNKDAVKNLENEFAIIALFRNPHIIKVHRMEYGIHKADKVKMMIMDQAICSLDEALDVITLQEVLSVLSDVGKALRCIHRTEDPVNGRYLSHNDLKIDNIVVSDGGHVMVGKLIDFGMADLEFARTLDWEGCTYAAPEVCESNIFSPEADIYMFGHVVALLGRRMHCGDLSKFARERMCLADPMERVNAQACITFFDSLKEHVKSCQYV